MWKLAVSVCCAVSLMGLWMVTDAEGRERPRNVYCRYGSLDHNPAWSDREVALLIRCASNKYGVNTQTALAVANRESGLEPNAYNPSGASGIFQHMASLWPGRRATFLTRHPYWHLAPSVFDARSNVMVAMDMVRRGGWGPWQ